MRTIQQQNTEVGETTPRTDTPALIGTTTMTIATNTLPSIAATTTTATAVIIMEVNTAATAVMGQQIDLVAKKMNQQQAVQEHQNIVLSPFWQNIKQMRSPDNSRQPIMEPSQTVQATTTATAMELSRQELIRTTHSREQRGRQRHQQHRATAFPQHCP